MSINCQLLFSAKEPCAWQLDPVQGRVVRLSLRLSSLIKKTRIVVEVSVKVDLYPEISLFCPSPDPSNQTTCSGNKFIKAFAPPYPWRWFHSFSSAGYVVTREFGYLNVVRVSDLIQCCFRYLGNSPCILGYIQEVVFSSKDVFFARILFVHCGRHDWRMVTHRWR